MIKNSKNIFITLFRGIWNFFKISFLSIFLLLWWNKKHITEEKSDEKFPFLSEMIEKWPRRFFAFPTAIRLGRAIFAPILYLFSQKNVQKNSEKK